MRKYKFVNASGVLYETYDSATAYNVARVLSSRKFGRDVLVAVESSNNEFDIVLQLRNFMSYVSHKGERKKTFEKEFAENGSDYYLSLIK